MTTRRRLFILGAVLLAAVAGAGSIKVWSTGEYITSTDLNANFAHIHNQMVGGHGARLVNADVSSSAAISHSKLATPSLVPKLWVATDTCNGATDGGSGGTCNLLDSSGVTSVTAGTTGNYSVLFPARGSTNYGVLVTGAGTGNICVPGARTTTTVAVFCSASGVGANALFTLLLMDTEN